MKSGLEKPLRWSGFFALVRRCGKCYLQLVIPAQAGIQSLGV
jgi:hypothetical protein